MNINPSFITRPDIQIPASGAPYLCFNTTHKNWYCYNGKESILASGKKDAIRQFRDLATPPHGLDGNIPTLVITSSTIPMRHPGCQWMELRYVIA